MPGFAQSFERALDIVRGPHDTNALQKIRPLAADILAGIDPADAGCGVHINNNGDWELGATGHQIPFFLWHSSDALDVYISGVSPITGRTHFLAPWPTGVATGFYAAGGYEFQTTAFDDDQIYLPNDPLTLTAEGLVTNEDAVPYIALICGYATWHENGEQHAATLGPVGMNSHGMETLTFFGAFLPAVDIAALNAVMNP